MDGRTVDETNIEKKVEELIKANSIILENLVKENDTPLYVYLSEIIIHKCNLFTSAMNNLSFKNKRLFYALKANSNIEILKLLRANGVTGVDCVSKGEIYIAQKVGFKKKDILYTGNNNTLKEIKSVFDEGVLINFNDVEVLERFCSYYNLSNFDICVRVNLGMGLGGHEYIKTAGYLNKFGIKVNEFQRLFEVISTFNLKLVGIHQHSGSNIKNKEEYLEVIRRYLELISEYKCVSKCEKLKDLQFINFGGGFGVQYNSSETHLDLLELFTEFDALVKNYTEYFNNDICAIFEPGRYLLAESGLLISSITSKRYLDEENLFLGCNTGMNHLIRPALYGSYHNIYSLSADFNFYNNSIHQGDNNKECEISCKSKNIYVSIYGNICENSDFFAKNLVFNKDSFPVKNDDIIAFLNSGAYGISMSSNYNSRSIPPEIILYNNSTYLVIRGKQTIEDILARC